MRLTLSVAFLGALLLAAGAIAGGCRPPPAPETPLVRALASDDAAVAAGAVAEVAALDRAGQERVVRRLARELGRYPFGLANGAVALRRIAPVAVPVLLELRTEPDLRAQADNALQNMGRTAVAAVPALERSLDEPDRQHRLWAAGALAWIAPERVPAAIGRTAEGDPGVAIGLGLALRYAPDATGAVPGLAAILRDDDRPRAREFAAAALAELGARAVAARPELVALVRDPDARVRRQAERALAAVGAPPDEAAAASRPAQR